jgi:hypothetical protein
MADEIKPDELGLYKHHFSITHELESHPWFVSIAIVGVFLIIMYLFANLHAGTSTSDTTPTSQQQDQLFTTPPPGTLPPTPLPPPPPPDQSVLMHIRPKGSQSWDKTHNGPPYYKDPFGSSTTIVFGTPVTVLKTGVPGANHSNGGVYSQISWTGGIGYVASQDLTT